MTFHYEFDDTDAFATGAIGQPGERTFYVQIRAEGRTIAVKCEKQQVAQMAEHLRNMLADVGSPAQPPSPQIAMLESPVEPDFVLGTIGLGVDHASQRLVVQLEEAVAVDPEDLEDVDTEDPEAVMEFIRRMEDETEASMVRVLLTPAQAVAFCDMAENIVLAGRSMCKWCGGPIDRSGHACPKMN